MRREIGESEKVDLKLYIQKLEIMSSGSISLWQVNGEKVATVTDFIFLGCKITADKIKRHLLLGRKPLPNVDRDIILMTKVHIVNAIVFPVVIYGCESWTRKKVE